MPQPAFTYPGVYLTEIDSKERTMTGVGGTVALFIGTASGARATADMRVRSFTEFEAEFRKEKVLVQDDKGTLDKNGNTLPTGRTIPSSEKYTYVEAQKEGPLDYAVFQYFLNGGSEAIILNTDPAQESFTQDLLLKTLERHKYFNLIYIAFREDTSIASRTTPLGTVVSFTEKACRAVIIADFPAEVVENGRATLVDPAGAIEELNSLVSAHKNVAVYYPHLQMMDPFNRDSKTPIAVPPGGAVAGLMGRLDADRGIWKAPAGLEATLRGCLGTVVPVGDATSGDLNQVGINAIRELPGVGTVIWGARTMMGKDQDSSAPQWKYVPVRRLALYIEESLLRGTRWAVFEPNDEPLWSQLRQSVGGFMHGLFRQGAFKGSKPSEAYFVKCDKENNLPDMINQGVVTIDVGFAPLKPAEFVWVRLQQISAQAAN